VDCTITASNTETIDLRGTFLAISFFQPIMLRYAHMIHTIDGKAIAQKLLDSLKKQIAQLPTQPKLAVVYVGDDKPSRTYIRRKQQAAEYVGIDFALHTFPPHISKQDLIQNIITIQKDKNLSGVIVQLPLPEPLYTDEVLNAVRPEFDVDCLTDTNIGKLVMKTHAITPPTPEAVCVVLDEIAVNVEGKNITIIGAGALVGKPLSVMLLNRKATVTTCNSRTKNLKKHCRKADIIVSAVGKKDLVRGNMVKKGTIVIDTGISFEKGKMYGDINFKEVSKKASYVTPTPGGIGPITVALLLKNVIQLSSQNLQN